MFDIGASKGIGNGLTRHVLGHSNSCFRAANRRLFRAAICEILPFHMRHLRIGRGSMMIVNVQK